VSRFALPLYHPIVPVASPSIPVYTDLPPHSHHGNTMPPSRLVFQGITKYTTT
jgi:hypothetical protein